jgi:hypothetical protein
MSFLFALPLMLAATVALTPVGGADNPPATEPVSIKLSDTVSAGKVCGSDGNCVALTSDGKLSLIDLKTKQVTALSKLADVQVPSVDVVSGRVCVADGSKAHVLETTSGKTLASLDLKDRVYGVGFLGTSTAFARTATTVTVFEAASGKVQRTIELIDKPAKEHPEIASHFLYRDRLYVPSAYDGSLVIVDLKEGKVHDRITSNDWRLGSVLVSGDKAFVVGLRLGYGVWTESLAAIDLQTKKITPLKLPTALLHQTTLLGAPDGTFFLVNPNLAFRYDADGKLLGQVETKDRGRLIGFWNGQMVSTGRDALELTPLAAVPGQDPWIGTFVRNNRGDLATSKAERNIAMTIVREADGYRVSPIYGSTWKFIEVKKGVLRDEEGILGTIEVVKSASAREATALKAEFCYEWFELCREGSVPKITIEK